MSIRKVWIVDGCIACGLCSETAPEVFELNDIAHVKSGVDLSLYEEGIREVAHNCPVEVIKIEEN